MRQALPYRPRFNAPPAPVRPARSARAALVRRPRANLVRFWVLVGGMLLLGLLSQAVGAQGMSGAARRSQDSALAVATVDSAWSRIAHTYYDTTFRGQNWFAIGQAARDRAARAKGMGEVRAAIEAMFSALGESHFALVPSEAIGSWSDAPVDGEALGDVGLEFRYLDGDVIVSRVRPASPAAAAGVHAGWVLRTLGSLDVSTFARQRLNVGSGSAHRLAELQLPLSLMGRTQGQVGSVLRASFRDGQGRERSIAVARRPVQGEVVHYGHLPPQVVRFETERFTDELGCVGVLRFNVWMTPVMARLDDAMVDFQRCRGIVLDLRGNVGGVAAMVMGIGGYFVDSVTSLGTMTTRQSALRYLANPRRSDRRGAPLAPFSGQLAIVVDGLSASTSEMFAAAMQVVGRARIFGETTAGQALPAMLVPLPNGDVMQYVVADFTAPDGRRIESRGVVPDLHRPLRRSALLAGRDEAFADALAWAGTLPVTTAAATVWPSGVPRR